MAWSNTIFYIAFTAQILLISYYIPRKLTERMQYVFENYPPSEYPKLYPKPVENYRLANLVFKFICRAILVLGFVLLFAIMFLIDHSGFADDGYISEAFPMGYGLIQFIPLMFVEFSEYNQLKQMRLLNTNPTRRADLRKRGLFDAVSPMLLLAAVAAAGLSLLSDLYVQGFDFSFGSDAAGRSLTLIGTNIVLCAFGAWHLYGRKLNPHQTNSDRMQRTAANLKSLVYVSIAMSVYFITLAADDVYNLDFIDAILVSLYFQAIVLLSIGSLMRDIQPDDVDFSVYKADQATV